jgi:hypothetical protein
VSSLPPGTRVKFRDGEVDKLVYPPPAEADSFVAVHHGALKAPGNGLTLVVSVEQQHMAWVGAVDEQMVEDQETAVNANPRAILKTYIGVGARLWQVVSPGLLTAPHIPRPLHTVYDGERPWVILGELPNGSVLAAPLNDATGNPKWWAPQVGPPVLDIPGGKLSQIELAHLWALEPPDAVRGSVHATNKLKDSVKEYFTG